MDIQSTFETDMDRITGGAWIQIGDAQFLIQHFHSRQTEQQIKKIKLQQFSTMNTSQFDEEEVYAIWLGRHGVRNWTNVHNRSSELEYSPAQSMALFTNENYRPLVKLLIQESANYTNYLKFHHEDKCNNIKAVIYDGVYGIDRSEDLAIIEHIHGIDSDEYKNVLAEQPDELDHEQMTFLQIFNEARKLSAEQPCTPKQICELSNYSSLLVDQVESILAILEPYYFEIKAEKAKKDADKAKNKGKS